MALPLFNTDVENISKLDNEPSDDAGFNPDALKAQFDKAGVDIKNYINGTLIPAIEVGYIESIARTSGNGFPGTADTYTVTFTDGGTMTFSIYNGADGAQGIQGIQGATGDTGKSPEFQKTATHIQWRYVSDADWVDLVALADIKGDTGAKGLTGETGVTGESGATGRGISSVVLVSGNHTAGTTDTYRITYSDATTFDFTVYNGDIRPRS